VSPVQPPRPPRTQADVDLFYRELRLRREEKKQVCADLSLSLCIAVC
jgi:hypothetical protein